MSGKNEFGEGENPPPPPPPPEPPAPPPEDDDPDDTAESRWRRRALEAEALGEHLRQRLASLSAELAACREAIDACERRHRTDLALLEADVVDLETARLLTEAAVARMDETDVAAAIEDLRRTKPFLFRRRRDDGRPPAAGMAAAHADAAAHDTAAAALEEASLTGDRAALLRYLRLRRR